MPNAQRKALKKKTKSKPEKKTRKACHPRRSSLKTSSRLNRKTTTEKEYVTYVYECTRPGCGYKIWRDDKGEPGQLRNDLKCPKCHHVEFRCLGEGDLPESFQVPIPANAIDLGAVGAANIV
jgi:hypothetical protein